MEVISQAPQPTIKCYRSIINGKASNYCYMEFSPNSIYESGRNLQSYNFERSLENFGGSFSFTIKEDTEKLNNPFMDQVQPLDVIVISESGSDMNRDFIGVVTTISIGAIAGTLNKVVTISGKSIEWLFNYLNINADIKVAIFDNSTASKAFKADFENNNGKTGYSIRNIITTSIDYFKKETAKFKEISNYLIGDIIDLWFKDGYIVAPDDTFPYPISSNLFDGDKITVIEFIKKILPPPIYEIYSIIDAFNNLKLIFRKAPFDNPVASYAINPTHLTDYTLTKSCEEVYTAFMTYIEGTELSPDFYMNKAAAQGDKLRGYDFAKSNLEKVKQYGYQLLTCTFVGYNATPDAKTDKDKIEQMNKDLEKWFSNLDEMYSGDITITNIVNETKAKIGDWLSLAGALYYVVSEKHSWNYGDNPMINYQVIRGGKYTDGNFQPITKLSTIYKEFDQ